MRKKRLKIGCFVLLILFSLGFLSMIFTIRSEMNQTTAQTAEYTATVARVLIGQDTETSDVLLVTNEWPCVLCVDAQLLDDGETGRQLRSLAEEQRIWFRVQKTYEDALRDTGFFSIVSLRTEAGDIFSLRDYNACMCVEMRPMLITAGAAALLFAFGAVMMGRTIFRKKE